MGAPAGQVRGKRGGPGRGGPMKRGGRGRGGNINGGPPPLGRPMRGGPMGMRGAGRPPLPPPPMRGGGRGMGRGMQGPPRGMTGPPRGMGGPPRGMTGAPRGMSGSPRGMPGAPRGMSRAPRGMSGPPRGITGAPRGRGGPGSRGMPPHGVRPPPLGVRPPPGIRGPPPGMRPPPPMMMMRPPGPPPGRGGFRGGMRGGMKPGPFLRGGMRGGVRGGRIMRRNRPSLKNVDLSKPWVTDAIREEFGRKDELLVAAKNTQAQEDWAKYREQREKCSRIYQEAESANGGPAEGSDSWDDYVHEEDELVPEDAQIDDDYEEWWTSEDYSEYDDQETSYSCDTCERCFFTQEQYDQHMSEHQTCNLDGCKFTAHEKIVAKHIEMQHATGLFNKIKLDSPEDIAKWIESRKKNYPSKENIEKRYQKQEAMLKKGIRLGKHPNKFGKDKFRLASTAKAGQHIKNRTKRLVKKKRLRPPPKVSLIDEKADWNGNMFPFRGTAELFKDCSEEEKDAISDDGEEWDSMPNVVAPKVNNSLGCLMAAYDSDNDDEDLEETNQLQDTGGKAESTTPRQIESAHDSDNEPPDEVKIVKKEEESCLKPVPPSKPKAEISSRKHKRRKLVPKKGVINRKKVQTNSKRSHTDNFPHNRFKRRKITLLEKLLENEIRHERNMLLQCVRYVVQNNFFKN